MQDEGSLVATPPGRAEAEPSDGRTRWWIAAVAGILLLALGLRVAGLSQEALWGDEIHTLITAGRATLGEVAAATREAVNHPPAYFLLMHLWIGIAGDGDDAMVRLPSALAGVAAVGGIILLAATLWPARSCLPLTAGAMAAVSPFLIYYSQEARNYSFLVALEIVAAWAVFRLAMAAPAEAGWRSRAVTKETAPAARRRWATALVAVPAAVVTATVHHFGLLICGWAGAVLALTAARRWRDRPVAGVAARIHGEGPGPELAALALLVVGTIPFALRAVADLRRGSGLSWMPERLTLADLPAVVGAQVWGPMHAVVPRILAFPALAVVSAALLAALGAMGWRLVRRSDRGWEAPLLLGVGALFVAPIAWSLAVRPIIFYGNRYLIVAVPVLLLSLVSGLEIRGLRPLAALALILMIACAAFYLADLYAHRQKRPWDLMAADLAPEIRPGDRIVVIPDLDAPLLDRYLEAPFEPAREEELFDPDGPPRLWLVSTADLREEIIERTPYRPKSFEIFPGRPPAAIYVIELARLKG